MTSTVMSLVLLGAFLHAGWNVLVKSSSDKVLDTALIHLFCSFIAIPILIWVGPPRAEAWPYLVASIGIHLAYYFALAKAYHHGDLSLTYPIMRGSAPLMVSIGSIFLFRETLNLGSWAGVLLVSVGVIWLGASAGFLNNRKALSFAVLNAAVIALYTLVDATGVRASDTAIQYIATLFALDGWIFAAVVLSRRTSTRKQYFLDRWPLMFGGAIASVASYAIALWAMTEAPVATVAALRETSVLFAVLLGAVFLKERLTLSRLYAVSTIIVGAIFLRLS
jgi:phosphonate utilization associated putative membrane protein